ncbi:hypothetical protein L195_g028061 [Trifolium pratense]|uniref:Uncharacterized protein n=1 Tax=Trifolium pratense TaxID=57577 RepID=A0A2K3L0V2_TRIPR|nr:hypothetical protein L195_g028061 [Trifolium pratense]
MQEQRVNWSLRIQEEWRTRVSNINTSVFMTGTCLRWIWVSFGEFRITGLYWCSSLSEQTGSFSERVRQLLARRGIFPGCVR